MPLRDILRIKGSDVYTTHPDATLQEVVETLVHFNCGSLVVCPADQPRRMAGIITERDILRASASSRSPLTQIRVSQVMTRDVVTAAPDDSVESLMGMMTTHRIRHMPVLDGDELVGLISIGDIVKAKHDELTMENHYLKSYIHG